MSAKTEIMEIFNKHINDLKKDRDLQIKEYEDHIDEYEDFSDDYYEIHDLIYNFNADIELLQSVKKEVYKKLSQKPEGDAQWNNIEIE